MSGYGRKEICVKTGEPPEAVAHLSNDCNYVFPPILCHWLQFWLHTNTAAANVKKFHQFPVNNESKIVTVITCGNWSARDYIEKETTAAHFIASKLIKCFGLAGLGSGPSSCTMYMS